MEEDTETIINATTKLLCCIEKNVGNQTVKNFNFRQTYSSVKPCFPSNASYHDVIIFIFDHFHRPSAGDKPFVTCPTLSAHEIINRCTLPTSSINVAYALFWMILLLIAVIGNSLVCFAVFHSPSLRNNLTNYFVASLAVSDFLLAVILIPLKIDFTIRNQNFCRNISVCRLYFTMDNIVFSASILNLLVIAIDRYIALARPYQYSNLMNFKRTRLVIIFTWLLSILIGSLTNVDWENFSTNGVTIKDNICISTNGYFVTVVYVIVFLIPSIGMGLAYAKILRIALYHARIIASLKLIGTIETEEQKKKNLRNMTKNSMELKATRTIVVVYGSFVACWLPVAIISLVNAWCPKCITFKKWHYILFVEILPMLNCALNFFIYAVMNTQFRKAFRDIIVLKCFNKEILQKTSFNPSRRVTLTSVTTV